MFESSRHYASLWLPELVDLNTYISAERSNRFKAAKIKKEMTQLVAQECIRQKLPKLQKIDQFAIIWRHKNKKKDFDNVEFAQKWIRDGMVTAGVLPNDGWAQFPPETKHAHQLIKKLEYNVFDENHNRIEWETPGCWVFISWLDEN